MDVMEEYDNIYEILGKKPTPLDFFLTNRYTSKVIDKIAPLINRSRLLDLEMDHFSHDRTEAAVKMGYDSAWVYHVPILRFSDSKTMYDIYGSGYNVVLDKKGNVGTPMYSGGLIKSPADWDTWDKSDIFGLPARCNKVYSRIQKDFGDEIFIFGAPPVGIFDTTCLTLGFPRFAIALRKEKAFLRRFIKFYEDHVCMMIEAIADAGLPGMVHGDDMAYKSGPMVSPKQMDEFYGDSYRRVTETAHRNGMKIVVHTDGNVYPLLELFAEWGFDGVHALEPTANVELSKVKELIGDRLCLLGNMDITHILVDATKEEVYEAVRGSIAAAGRDGGYIIAPTNSHPDISLDRLRWMLEAVEEYGDYPLSVWSNRSKGACHEGLEEQSGSDHRCGQRDR
jgi:uroporphyrinogen decarboxylase